MRNNRSNWQDREGEAQNAARGFFAQRRSAIAASRVDMEAIVGAKLEEARARWRETERIFEVTCALRARLPEKHGQGEVDHALEQQTIARERFQSLLEQFRRVVLDGEWTDDCFA